jgi:hypothetical protein
MPRMQGRRGKTFLWVLVSVLVVVIVVAVILFLKHLI